MKHQGPGALKMAMVQILYEKKEEKVLQSEFDPLLFVTRQTVNSVNKRKLSYI